MDKGGGQDWRRVRRTALRGMRRYGGLAVFVAAILLVLSGAGDEGRASFVQGPAARGALPPASGVGSCANAAPHAAGRFTFSLMVDGLAREYTLHVPPSYDGTVAVPLVLDIHGYDSSAEVQAEYSGFPALADQERFVVAYPRALGDPAVWNYAAPAGRNDVGYVEALLDDVRSRLCIDPSRVYVAGMSDGGAFASAIACELSEEIAAVATVAATFLPPECDGRRPVPLIALAGTEDPYVPYEGGPRAGGLGAIVGIRVPPVTEAVAGWAAGNGCSTATPIPDTPPAVRGTRFVDCFAGATVELHAVEGGGHVWYAEEVATTDVIWDFFLRHPRR